VGRFHRPTNYEVDQGEEGGFGGGDVVVWRDGKILAVVRRDADGKPEATRFDADAGGVIAEGVITTDRPPGPRVPGGFDPVLVGLRQVEHQLAQMKQQVVAIGSKLDELTKA